MPSLRRRIHALSLAACIVCLAALGACAEETRRDASLLENEAASAPVVLSAEEQVQGWKLLFNGQDFDGWRGVGRDSVAAGHWEIIDGAIRKIPTVGVPLHPMGLPLDSGDLMTVDTYKDFELSIDYILPEGANSGIKYNVSESLSTAYPPANAALGFEYQLTDNDRSGLRSLASIYQLCGTSASPPRNPAGEWNTARILKQGNHLEHWLNGVKVVDCEMGSGPWNENLAASNYTEFPGFADNRAGHIVLQDHTHEVFFRNVKIRTLLPQ